ncbi:ATP-binding protein [[Eubacterium] cellulosolvens]
MIKFKKPGSVQKSTPTSAQALLDKGIKPSLPLDELHKTILKRLGQLREERLTEDQVLQALFPTTILDTETLEVVVSTLLAGNHMVLFGPPGSGKTNLAKDIWELFPKRVVAVQDCPVQDHPYSLVDRGYSKLVQPCPQCKLKYGNITEIGDFKIDNVDPNEIPVIRLNMHEGFGFARVQGSPEVFPDNLTGTINIHKLEELGDPTSPLVLEPGKLLQANRGLLIIDEIGKLPIGTQNVLLQALQERIVTPAKSRDTYPASFIAVATSNLDDLDNINEPLNDRLANIYVGFNKKHTNNRAILDLNLSDQRQTVFIPDIFIESSIYIIEAWRRVAGEIHELSEVGSNRTMIDNIRRSVAYSILNQKNTLTIDDFNRGVHDAMLGRIRARGGDSFIQNKTTIEGFIEKHFQEEVARAANRYWCNFFNQNLNGNRAVGKKTLEESKTILGDKNLLAQTLATEDGYEKFRKFAKYVQRRERHKGKLKQESMLINVFNLMLELNVFSCD